MIPILDTHLHLLYPKNFTYEWCADFPPLQADFTIEGYEELTQDLGILGAIFMEVDVPESQISKEAKFFSELANDEQNKLAGVIAACRPESKNFYELLEASLSDKVCGLRRVLHVVPDELSQSDLFRKNIQSLSNRNLPFDLCINQSQHEITHDLIKSCPDTQFVLDHCGGPTLDQENFTIWHNSLKSISLLPNVVCKISGIIASLPTESDVTTLNPWLDSTLEHFGADRVMIGSDWPVCNLSKDVPTWLNKVRTHFANLSEDEQRKLFHQNAERVYGMNISK